MNDQQLECTEGIVSKLIIEIAHLRKENSELKSRISLHNETENNNEGGYTDQEFDELAKAYADFGY